MDLWHINCVMLMCCSSEAQQCCLTRSVELCEPGSHLMPSFHVLRDLRTMFWAWAYYTRFKPIGAVENEENDDDNTYNDNDAQQDQ